MFDMGIMGNSIHEECRIDDMLQSCVIMQFDNNACHVITHVYCDL